MSKVRRLFQAGNTILAPSTNPDQLIFSWTNALCLYLRGGQKIFANIIVPAEIKTVTTAIALQNGNEMKTTFCITKVLFWDTKALFS